jgi:hypothetical protein
MNEEEAVNAFKEYMQLSPAEMQLFYACDSLANNSEPGEVEDFYRQQLEIGRMMMREEVINEITGAYSETTREELDGRR